MAYEGENIFQCARTPYPWQLTHVITVSGARWNPCGHTLLNVGGTSGHYFHIAGDGYDRPYHMQGAASFGRYLRENSKKELRRMVVSIVDPDGAQRKLEQLTSREWLWGVLPNNCASFVEAVVQAGGSKTGLYSNCPAKERWN